MFLVVLRKGDVVLARYCREHCILQLCRDQCDEGAVGNFAHGSRLCEDSHHLGGVSGSSVARVSPDAGKQCILPTGLKVKLFDSSSLMVVSQDFKVQNAGRLK